MRSVERLDERARQAVVPEVQGQESTSAASKAVNSRTLATVDCSALFFLTNPYASMYGPLHTTWPVAL